MELEGLLAAAHKGHDKERVVIGGTPKFKITWPKINKKKLVTYARRRRKNVRAPRTALTGRLKADWTPWGSVCYKNCIRVKVFDSKNFFKEKAVS